VMTGNCGSRSGAVMTSEGRSVPASACQTRRTLAQRRHRRERRHTLHDHTLKPHMSNASEPALRGKASLSIKYPMWTIRNWL
jgi:hypothetical protein